MPPKPDVGRLRLLHDLESQFSVPSDALDLLRQQLPGSELDLVGRFSRGFRTEDWFKWIYSAIPWVVMIHGLDQHQLPVESKAQYQVPDYLLLVERSDRTHQPILVEVKRVQAPKTTLKVGVSQFEQCRSYADVMGAPLLYAVFWDFLGGWTINTPGTFSERSSSRKLQMARAFEYDCAYYLGDVSYLVRQPLRRVLRYDAAERGDSDVRHAKYGSLMSDEVATEEVSYAPSRVESAALDSVLGMREVSAHQEGNVVSVTEEMESDHIPKLSSWITRSLALFGVEPSEIDARVSSHMISELAGQLRFPLLRLRPKEDYGGIAEIRELLRYPIFQA